jgi:hypothetical protein
MERINQISKMPNEQFKRIIGTTKPTFQEMLEILQAAYTKLHLPSGKPPKLFCGDKLLITLQYDREYRTMEHIVVDDGVSKNSVHRSIVWVENILSANCRLILDRIMHDYLFLCVLQKYCPSGKGGCLILLSLYDIM